MVLGRTRRFGPVIRSVATKVIGTRLPPGLDAEQVRAHRHPVCAAAERPELDDVVTVRTYADRGSQAAHIARELRLAHVRREVPWRELAVLVRSGSQIPALQRALHAAGVPVVVAADEIPLRSEPAVATLLARHGAGRAPAAVPALARCSTSSWGRWPD